MKFLASEFKDMDIECKDCGRVFTFTATEQAFYAEKGITAPKRCRKCRSERKKANNATGTTVICADCGEAFIITEAEANYFEINGLQQPKRCKKCRSKRKARNSSNNTVSDK
jgi:hypothetical protein